MQVFGKLANCSLVIKKLYMENILEWFQLKSNKKLIYVYIQDHKTVLVPNIHTWHTALKVHYSMTGQH